MSTAMNKYILAGVLLSTSPFALANNYVEITTNLGKIEVELFSKQAPISSKNFIQYVKSNFYQGTTFHRVIPGFMIQGGGFDAQMQAKTAGQPIINESYNGLTNTRGTLAMARTNDPNSANSQFFINLEDNPALNKNPYDTGYAVFGKVTQGMDIVDKISHVATASQGRYQNVPVTPVIITKMTVKNK